MVYAYARVSTKEQNLDRQLEEFKKHTIDKVYAEKQSGKDFNSRKVYQTLKKRLSGGDLLIILSIDRLGRNYQEILEEWRYITTIKKCDIQVLDMPILNTKNGINGLDGKFISDLVLQILAYVSQKEREKIKERQEQGIRIAKEKGVRFGRPKMKEPENLDEVLRAYKNNEMTYYEAMSELQLSRGTFFKFVKEYNMGKTMDKEKQIRKRKIVKCYMKDGSMITSHSISALEDRLFAGRGTVAHFIKSGFKKTYLADTVEKIEISYEEIL